MKAWKAVYGLFILALGFTSASAEYAPLRSDIQGDRPQVTILRHNADQVQLEVRIPGVQILEGTLEGRRWDRVEIPGGGYEYETGAPEVPHFTRLLAIPATAGVRTEFETLETTTFSGVELMPAQGVDPMDLSRDSHPIQFDMTAYSRDSFYPETEVSYGEPALIRGLRVVTLQMNPVRYNPVTKELSIAHRFRVMVHFEGTDLRNTPNRPMRPVSRSWAKLMRSMVMNFDELGLDETEMGSYLIVCVYDTTLINNLQPLIDWKRRKGHTVVIETFSQGASTTTIKNIIQNAYDTWDVPPEFVLLWGDTSGDYTLPGYESYGLDHPYSQLDGNDILADVAIGRLPAENSYETMVMVNKVLFYEKYPYITNSDWYHQAVLVAGSSSSGLSTIQTKRWIKTRMIWNEYTRIDTFWYYMSGSVPSVVSNAINNGVTYFNYRGYWGISGWDNYDIDQLTNGRKLPYCTIITCATGGFSGDSNMEHFVSVGTPSTPKGAVACVGTASLSTNTRCNNTVDVGIYAGIFDEGITQVGNTLNRGKLELYNAYQTNSSSYVTNYSKWNALAGDPGLELFTGAIQYMTCSVPSTVTWGENLLSLSVNETGVGPLQGAVVCLYKSGELHQVGLTDASGQITLPLNVGTTGNVKVTITKQNFYPIVDSLDVVQAAVAVGYYRHAIDDDNSGTSSGDDDGTINPGETVEIPLVFKNYGLSTPATGVSVTAAESDEYATLDDNYETFPNLAPGATGNSDDDFDLTIADNCPHGHVVRLDMVTNTDQGSWNGVLDLEVISYDMQIRRAYASGGDTLLSPGETADFILEVDNGGGKAATSLTATMVSLDSYVTVNDNSASFGTVNVGSSATCSGDPFNLTANIGTPPGHFADLEVTFTSSTGATRMDTITIVLGLKNEFDPQGPDEYGYYCFDNTDTNYPLAPVYSWEEIDPNYGGSGTQLPINDPGEDDDMSVNVQLPFTFRYYGEDVNEITVCSNGWISTWPNVSFNDFRNYPIPSSMGPNGMIAPFWDDLITCSDGHVFAKDDAANHRFIIEWSRMKNRGDTGVRETFEIILFDPVYYTTPTGDGKILFQYYDITEVSGAYYDNPYSTVGIERPDKQDGIEVVYWNTYNDPAAAHLQDSRAYLFTTNFDLTGDPPIIGVEPTSLTINVPEGWFASEQLTISNTGGTYLVFSTSFTYDDLLTIVIPRNPGGTYDAGGPDNFGYTWIDSDDPGGPEYNWVDISGIGTPITFVHNDSTTEEMPIGFSFPFYGDFRSEYIISPNGWISFSSHSGTWTNTSIPNPEAPLDLVSGFWDDLDPLQAGVDVLAWSNNADSLMVSFLAVPHWGSTTVGTYTYQMILTADGTITFQYQALEGNYQSCTVGIQNGTGTDGLQVAYDQTYLHENLAVQFYLPFLRAEPPSGAVPAGGSTVVNVTAYSYGLEPGTYPAVLGIDCNDPVTPHVDVPLTINVGGGIPAPLEVTMDPVNPPIVIPAGGGTFDFTAGIANVSGTTQQFDFWIMVDLPGGIPFGPILLRQGLSLASGASISRGMSQSIPAGAPAGEYYYYGIAGFHPDSVIATEGFNFTKEAGMDKGYSLSDWNITGWEDEDAAVQLPSEFAFRGCRPNPFNPVTEVLFDLPQAANVRIVIYDVLGRQVAVLQDGFMNGGSHAVSWQARNLSSGVYFLHFQSESFTTTSKLLLLK